jgi:hypothetical protein
MQGKSHDSRIQLPMLSLRRIPAGLALVLFFMAFTVFLMGWHLYSPDEEVVFRTAESLAHNCDLAILPIEGGFSTSKGKDGRQYGQYGLGQPILAVPFVFLGEGIAALTPDCLLSAFPRNVIVNQGRGQAWPVRTYVNGKNQVYRAHYNVFFPVHHDEGSLHDWMLRGAVSRMGQLTTALSMFILYCWAFLITGSRRAGLATGLLYGFCTVAFPHSRTFFSEPTVVLGLVWALYRLYRLDYLRRNNECCHSIYPGREVLYAGAGMALMLLTRSDSVFLLCGVGLYALFLVNTTSSSFSQRFMRTGLLGLFPMLAVGAILYANYWRFGSVFSTGYEDQAGGFAFDTPLLYGLRGFLLSPGRSIFVFSPLLLLAPWGFYHLWKREKALCLTIFICGGMHLIAMSTWRNWGGGWDWGPRHIFQLTPLLLLPICTLLHDRALVGWKKGGLALLIVLALLMNALGSLVFTWDSHRRLHDNALRSGENPYARMAHSPFVLADSTPMMHLKLLLGTEARSVVADLGEWVPSTPKQYSRYDYDLFSLKLVRAPIGKWKLLLLIPFTVSILTGVRLWQLLFTREGSASVCPKS